MGEASPLSGARHCGAIRGVLHETKPVSAAAGGVMQAIGQHAVRRAPAVTEAEILQGLFSAIGSVITIFSLLFTMVSGYLAALYLFLGHAPFALRLMAFALLSSGLVFLGGSVAVIQTMQNGLFAAWAKLPSPAIDLRELRNPLPLELSGMVPFSQQQIGVGVGWASALFVYLALAYLTFIYRWPSHGHAPTGGGASDA